MTNLYHEKTDLSHISYDTDLNSDNDKNLMENEVAYYERLCQDLKIVPCSIVIKSLPTESIVLCNYGLNSTGTLALANVLKVPRFFFWNILSDSNFELSNIE